MPRSTTETINIIGILRLLFLNGINNISKWDKITSTFEIDSKKKKLKILHDNVKKTKKYWRKAKPLVEMQEDAQMILDSDLENRFFTVETFNEIIEQIEKNEAEFNSIMYKTSEADLYKTLTEGILKEDDDELSEEEEQESNTEEDDDFEDIFTADESKNQLIPQSFTHRDGNKIKSLATPGEKGYHLVKIEITDYKDIKNISAGDRWRHVNKKLLFLTESPVDPVYLKLNSIVRTTVRKLSQIKNVRKEVKGLKRFNPY